jgi:hypothetical protein
MPEWVRLVAASLNRLIIGNPVLKSYTVATVPTGEPGEMIYVTDESGGPTPAYSDGTDWRRTSDGAVVS